MPSRSAIAAEAPVQRHPHWLPIAVSGNNFGGFAIHFASFCLLLGVLGFVCRTQLEERLIGLGRRVEKRIAPRHDTAAHLVDRVLPDVPYRQWVLSLPRPLRFLLAYRPQFLRPVLQTFLRAVFAWQRRNARRASIVDSRPGAVTFIQRFGSALNLNIHFHALLPDGVFVRAHDGAVTFVGIAPPSDDDILDITCKITAASLRSSPRSRTTSARTAMTPRRSCTPRPCGRRVTPQRRGSRACPAGAAPSSTASPFTPTSTSARAPHWARAPLSLRRAPAAGAFPAEHAPRRTHRLPLQARAPRRHRPPGARADRLPRQARRAGAPATHSPGPLPRRLRAQRQGTPARHPDCCGRFIGQRARTSRTTTCRTSPRLRRAAPTRLRRRRSAVSASVTGA